MENTSYCRGHWNTAWGWSLSFGGMSMEEATAAVEKEFGEAPPRYLLERMAQFYPPRLTCPCGLELWGSG